MNDISPLEILTILLAGAATLAIFSYLLGENPLYRLFEHLFIGIAAGLSPILAIRDQIWPQVFAPMLGLNLENFPDGTPVVQYEPLYLLYLIPMAIGLLYYTLYSKRHAWMAKIAIGITLGATGALAIKGFFAEAIPQIKSSFKPLLVFNSGEINWLLSFNNTLFVVILVLVLNYFFFTLGKENSIQGRTAQWGRPLLMVCFGAFFGSTVMARLALLVERVQFLLDTWCGTLFMLVTGG